MQSAASAFDSVDFTLGLCDTCDREVLTYVDYANEDERRLCVHCDAPVDSALRVTQGKELASTGYGEVSDGGGCGSGGGCSSGGCRRG